MDRSNDNIRTEGEDSCLGCSSLRRQVEVARQELHEARRSYQTALDVQRHLAAELDAAHSERERQDAARLVELGTARDRLVECRAERDELAAQLEARQEELKHALEPRPERARSPAPPEAPAPASAPFASPSAAEAQSQAALEAARDATVEAEAAAARWRTIAEEAARELASERAAAALRGAELRAALEREEEHAALLRAQHHELADTQPDHAVKGNSLFAEVEDKRQEMAHTLLLMKQKNAQLKRELTSARSDLEALERERRDVWRLAAEVDHHDQQLMDSYEERITVLEAVCERTRRGGRAGGLWGARGEHGGRVMAELVASSVRELARAGELREARRQLAAAHGTGGASGGSVGGA